MRSINSLTWLLIIIGGLNWLAVGTAQFDLVAALFGASPNLLTRIVYILVGVAAVYQLLLLFMSMSSGEVRTQRSSR